MALLDGKVIVVTGAKGNLGATMISTALNEGAKVIGLDYAQLDFQAENFEGFSGIDLTNAEATTALFTQIASKYGHIDGLANIAGGFCWETLADGDASSWDKMFRINVLTASNASRAALPALIKSAGKIVNIGAAGASKAGAGFGPYAASKAGVAKLTESLAEECKSQNVCVNAVLPSVIDTPLNRSDMPDADFSSWVSPRQLSEVLCFLLSAKADPITGALLPVTGRV
ncbi:SDR family NAD(P)-dependent oxidoreductase [Zhongshania sp.]|jgi:NAD(P)-dependent dehydrogenase (short-subunit alcohol dehydrogenase family)|uniref:SDR family NAD(P)-dependent oxidoreductase n=1 Tax=Zhongshania sp. TaxID=1971902 RepID=UPI001B7350A3|nr:SDR family NAD(P)-dependent oxidoreductase [Zhongshania sp.]MBQ0794844.1 SDR family NAD(P)-dependent oxidoreductase [Zhongshania sp.]